MSKLISGKEVSLKVKNQVAEETAELKKQGITPGLAVIIVGNDPASSCLLYTSPSPRDM